MNQTDWIDRRVETVSFTPEGTTRRSISFDCTIPVDRSQWLLWAPSKDSPATCLALPLTFLGKGELINLDVRDASGRALSTASRRDSFLIIQNSLEHFLHSPMESGEAGSDLSTMNARALSEIDAEIAGITKSLARVGEGARTEATGRLVSYLRLLDLLRQEIPGSPSDGGQTSTAGHPDKGNGRRRAGEAFYLAANQAQSEIINGTWLGGLRSEPASMAEAEEDCPSVLHRLAQRAVRSRLSDENFRRDHFRAMDGFLRSKLTRITDNESRPRGGVPQGDASPASCVLRGKAVLQDDKLMGDADFLWRSVDFSDINRHRQRMIRELISELYRDDLCRDKQCRDNGTDSLKGRSPWLAERESRRRTTGNSSVSRHRDASADRIRDDWSLRALYSFIRSWIDGIRAAEHRSCATRDSSVEPTTSAGADSADNGDSADKERKWAARERRRLTSYLLLLSSLCDTYPLYVLLPLTDAVPGGRVIIKLGFDAGYRQTIPSRIIPFNQTIHLAFQTYGAASSHIEIAPAPGIDLTGIEEMLSPENLQVARRYGGSSMHLSGRMAAGRLHLSTTSQDCWPLTRLRLTFMHQRNLLHSFLAWTLLFAALNIFMAWAVLSFRFWTPHVSSDDSLRNGSSLAQQIISFYKPENMLAFVAILFTMWVARRITAARHQVVAGLTHASNFVLSVDMLLTILGYALASVEVYADGGNVVYVSSYWRGWVGVVVCVIAALSFAAVVAAAIPVISYEFRGIRGDGRATVRVGPVWHLPHRDRHGDILYADRAAYSVVGDWPSPSRRGILESSWAWFNRRSSR